MPRLLIIDDERLARLTLRKILERAGHEVMEASTGNEGLAMFRAKPCDLVITDIIMPEKEGIQTIIELKRDFPNARVIAMSGGGRTHNMDFLRLASKCGAERVLAKPFAMDDVSAAINDVLGRPAPNQA